MHPCFFLFSVVVDLLICSSGVKSGMKSESLVFATFFHASGLLYTVTAKI